MLRRLTTLFASAVEKRIHRVEDRLRRHLEPRSYGKLWVHHFGATDIDPRHLVICVCVATDQERTELVNAGIAARVRLWLKEEGYPAEAIQGVGVSVDSQETVDRDWNGNWYQYYK
jgi:hypothetical protein